VKPAVLIATDLSWLRLLADGADETWRAPAPEDEQNPPPLRELAAAAADWLVPRLRGARLGLVALDIAESRCLWISTPTREPAVVAAAVRQRRSEWGDQDGASELIQPLVGPDGDAAPASTLESLPLLRYFAPGRATAAAGASAAVLEPPDAAVKLWLDALDARGVRVGEVASLWHLAARRSAGTGADQTSPPVLATVLADESRLVWAWGQGGALLAAGHSSLPSRAGAPAAAPSAVESNGRPDHRAAAAGRLALDWLTWSAQLGLAPARVEVLAPEPEPFVEVIRRAWPEADAGGVPAPDPAREVLAPAAEHPSAERDARRAAPALAQRPSRPHRRVYRLAALAIALVAVAVAGLGWRAQRAAARDVELRRDYVQRGRELVASVAPGYEDAPDLGAALQSYYAQIKKDNPPLEVPPDPKPIFDELRRLISAAAPIAGVTVNRIDLDERTSSAQFRIASYADGERLISDLDNDQNAGVEWSDRVNGTPPNLVQRLTGVWR